MMGRRRVMRALVVMAIVGATRIIVVEIRIAGRLMRSSRRWEIIVNVRGIVGRIVLRMVVLSGGRSPAERVVRRREIVLIISGREGWTGRRPRRRRTSFTAVVAQ